MVTTKVVPDFERLYAKHMTLKLYPKSLTPESLQILKEVKITLMLTHGHHQYPNPWKKIKEWNGITIIKFHLFR